MEYGREMMRYSFHEEGMPGGSNKYPAYDRYLDDDTLKKLAMSEFPKCGFIYLTNLISILQRMELDQNDSAI
jgi:hypothetical protein